MSIETALLREVIKRLDKLIEQGEPKIVIDDAPGIIDTITGIEKPVWIWDGKDIGSIVFVKSVNRWDVTITIHLPDEHGRRQSRSVPLNEFNNLFSDYEICEIAEERARDNWFPWKPKKSGNRITELSQLELGDRIRLCDHDGSWGKVLEVRELGLCNTVRLMARYEDSKSTPFSLNPVNYGLTALDGFYNHEEWLEKVSVEDVPEKFNLELNLVYRVDRSDHEHLPHEIVFDTKEPGTIKVGGKSFTFEQCAAMAKVVEWFANNRENLAIKID